MRLSATVLFLLVAASTAEAQNQGPSLRMIGFTDINYLKTDRDIRDGFREGQLIGHATAILTDRISHALEVSVTPSPTGFSVAVERTFIKYEHNDFFKVSAGRFHTPLGYWNTAFHHGLWLQSSVSRPEMVRFGSSFFPVHYVGLLVDGSLHRTSLGLSYIAGVGNGRDSNIAAAGDAGDVNDRRAFIFGLRARPASLFGLEAGATVYFDRISAGPASADEVIFTAHAAWTKETPEFITEFTHIMHDPLNDALDKAGSNAFYVQVAYRLAGELRKLKPYARFEVMQVADDDVVFGPLGLDYEAVVAGLRIDVAPLAAFKVEYRNEQFETSTRFHSLYLQLSFAFHGQLDMGS